MPELIPSDDTSIRPVLLLGFLAAITPTALLLAYRTEVGPIWYQPAAYTIIYVALALLSITIGRWLGREASLSNHPALAVLSGGFAGTAIITAIGTFVRHDQDIVAIRTASIAWMVIFGGGAVILLNAQGLRRTCRQLFVRSRVLFYACFMLLFALLFLAALVLDRRSLHAPAYAHVVQTGTLLVSSTLISLLLISSYRLYLRKRNTVILFFSLGLYLFTLGVLAQTAGAHWSLLWWFGQGLALMSLFTVAYGILEANRIRDRLELISTLAARTEEIDKSHLDLARSEAQYRSLVNNAPYGIFRFSESERFEAVNPALVELLGYDSAASLTQVHSCGELFKEAVEHQAVMEELQNTGHAMDDVFWQRKDGKVLKVRLRCRKVAGPNFEAPSYEAIVEDLSQQSSLEEQLRQSQKMEAIGRLPSSAVAEDGSDRAAGRRNRSRLQ